MFDICPSNRDVLLFLTGKAPAEAGARLLPHLDICEPCRLAVGEAVRELTGCPAVGPLQTFAEGELVGRYHVRRLVGRGGMGEVYEVFDQVLLERVALKTVRLGTPDAAAALARFKAEVQLARRVSHPNVCRVLEFGLHDRSPRYGAPETVPYFTMELLDGETLSARLAREGRLPPPCVAALAAQMAHALQAIHDAGIVHRDFKSDNVVLVGREGARALVTDFGLARIDQEGSGSSADAVVGTLDYIAPEQVLGSPATAASDVFALGVVVFEMLTGQRPFQGANRLQRAFSRIDAEAPAASSLVPALDPGWDGILRRCLSRAPAARFQNMTEMLEALRAIGAPVSPVPSRRPGLRRPLAILVAGAALAAAGGLLLTPRPEPDVPSATPPAPQVARLAQAPSVPSTLPRPAVALPVPTAATAPASNHRARPSRRRLPKVTDSPAPSPSPPRPEADARDAIVKPDFQSNRAVLPAAERVLSPFSRP